MPPLLLPRLAVFVSAFMLGATSTLEGQSRIGSASVQGLDSIRQVFESAYLYHPAPSPTRFLPVGGSFRKPYRVHSPLYVVDSIFTRYGSEYCRQIFSHYSTGQVASEVKQSFDSSAGKWYNVSRCSMTYDGQGNVDTLLEEYSTPGDSIWYSLERHIYDFGQGAHLMLAKQESGSGVSVRWSLMNSSSYTYDAQWRLLSRLRESYRGFDSLLTYNYDSHGWLTVLLRQRWKTDHWEDAERQTFSYDGDGRDTSMVRQVWRDSAWVTIYAYAFSYDARGNLHSTVTTDWQSWPPPTYWKEIYTYDLNSNKLTEKLTQKWERGIWVDGYRRRHDFDATGKEVTTWLENWYDGQWQSLRIGYNYDRRGNLIEVTTKVLSQLNNSIVDSLGVTDAAGNSYRIVVPSPSQARASIHWKLMDASTGDESSLTQYMLFQNYPNPFNPTTTIIYTVPERSHVRVVVFNMLGQEVARLVDADIEAGMHEVVFDASPFASGAYFYRISAGNFTQTRMLLLLR